VPAPRAAAGRAARESASHTTPDPLRVQQYLARFRDAGIETVAMEVSSHALAQGRVAAVEYHIGVFTNLSRDHLDYHHDMEDYFLAKASLFARPLPVAVINIDDAHGRRLLDENRVHPKTRVIAVSSQNHAHPRAALTLRARDIVLSPDGIAYTLETEAEQVAIQSGLLARFNVDNLLNTAACLLALGTPLAAIPAKLAALHGVPGRAERIGLGNGAAAIIDYAHTPAALANILQGVRAHVPGKLWCIYGCGGDRDKTKRPIMAQEAAAQSDTLVLTSDNPRTEDPQSILDDMAKGLDKDRLEDTIVIVDRRQAIKTACKLAKSGDIVLIAGKGHENYQIVGKEKHHFDDKEEVIAALNSKR